MRNGSGPAAVLESADDTRDRLIEAAGAVFAETGFHTATVRDICARARVNVAAVNYHFGDKLALYTEVLKHSVSAERHRATLEAMKHCASPEQALRLFIHSMCAKLQSDDRPAWHIRIMAQEMANPTPGLTAVIDHLIRPTYAQVCSLIGRILNRPQFDEVTRLCVHSIMGQVMHYLHARPVIAAVWPKFRMTPARVDQIADHITGLTLAGIAPYRRPERAPEEPLRRRRSRR
jgi:AcrR family transcriptional regulator